jgi:hypothetical protein
MSDRSAPPRPVGPAGVIGVLAVRDRYQPVLNDNLVGNPGEELVLAVEAAVRAVADVGPALALPGVHLHDLDAQVLGHAVRLLAFLGREAG